MKAVVAIDSFKGSLSTLQAGEAVREGIMSVYRDAEVKVMPIADGGEGTLDAVMSSVGSETVVTEVTLPLGDRGSARYGILEDGSAVIEIAEAAGLTLVPCDKRDPMNTTTFGVGELIRHAVSRGCREFTVGLGGSVTNDGGAGMLQALGFNLLDENGKEIDRGAIGLSRLCKIDTSGAIPELADCRFILACDVKNPLCGENGCTRVFSIQKGARDADLDKMDGWLSRYADIVKNVFTDSDKNAEGAGAAGGLGFAFMSCLGAEMRSGIEVVTSITGLEKEINTADIIVTGEGRLDGQSAMGKAPVGVAGLAKKYGKPVVAFAGCVREDATVLSSHGIDAYFPILQAPCTFDEAMNTDNAYKNLRSTAVQVFRLIKTGGLK